MKKSSKKGFTLVELVIVIAVIAILSAILVPTFGNVISSANDRKTVGKINSYTVDYLSVYAEGKLGQDGEDLRIALESGGVYFLADGSWWNYKTGGEIVKVEDTTLKGTLTDLTGNKKADFKDLQYAYLKGGTTAADAQDVKDWNGTAFPVASGS